MEIFQGVDSTLVGDARNVLLIKLFDKRRGVAYSNMNIIRFPHYTSALTRVSKLDIVTSEMHRFRLICSRYTDFCGEMASLLYAMKLRGYPVRLLKKKLRCMLRVWHELYYQQRSRAIRQGAIATNIINIFEAMYA